MKDELEEKEESIGKNRSLLKVNKWLLKVLNFRNALIHMRLMKKFSDIYFLKRYSYNFNWSYSLDYL